MQGRIIDGRYELLHEIGRGGMGTVYEARHTNLAKRFAIKLLNPDWSKDPTIRSQMENEAKAASRITHKNVVSVIHVGTTIDDVVYIVMELLEGVDLEYLILAHGALELERARGILVQVAAGLVAAHEKNVIHRDIKPANIMVQAVEGEQERDHVKVLDFGIAKITEETGETAQLLTTPGRWGTRRYIAPEVQEGAASSPASDVFSFGVLAYRTLTGQFPYQAGSEEPIPPEIYRSDLPYDLRDLLVAMLQRRPERRPQTMLEVLESLKRERRQHQPTQVALTVAEPRPAVDVESTFPEGSEPITLPPGGSGAILVKAARPMVRVMRWSLSVISMGLLSALISIAIAGEVNPTDVDQEASKKSMDHLLASLHENIRPLIEELRSPPSDSPRASEPPPKLDPIPPPFVPPEPPVAPKDEPGSKKPPRRPPKGGEPPSPVTIKFIRAHDGDLLVELSRAQRRTARRLATTVITKCMAPIIEPATGIKLEFLVDASSREIGTPSARSDSEEVERCMSRALLKHDPPDLPPAHYTITANTSPVPRAR